MIFICTAISLNEKAHLFGRTLDLEYSYDESVAIVPRGFELKFLHETALSSYAIIGACHIVDGVPLFYDGMNECGLCMAALSFPNYARYKDVKSGMINVASFELIAFILRQCTDLKDALSLLKRINITSESYSPDLACTELHWIISDKSGSYVLEPTENGLEIYENPFGVLTNAPDFSYHKINVCNYISLDSYQPKCTLCKSAELEPYSRGMGAQGLCGDFSSASRFVRALFVKEHLSRSENEINDFFSIMGAVNIPNGCVKTDTGKDVCTVYTSCCHTRSKNYYFTTSACQRISCVRMNDVNLDSSTLFAYKMKQGNEYKYLN